MMILIKTAKFPPVDSFIFSILLYGLITIEIKNQLKKLQSFYSGCVGYLVIGKYENQKGERERNYSVRTKLNIPAIESRTEYNKLKTYISWGNTMSFAYLNNTNEINERINN